jgi:hypothetical protein
MSGHGWNAATEDTFIILPCLLSTISCKNNFVIIVKALIFRSIIHKSFCEDDFEKGQKSPNHALLTRYSI